MNYQFKGTPGPWKIRDKSENIKHPDGESVHTSTYIGTENCCLATTLGIKFTREKASGWGLIEHAIPNGHLIAAAPEMLDALMAARDILRILNQDKGGTYEAIVNAIKKALNLQNED